MIRWVCAILAIMLVFGCAGKTPSDTNIVQNTRQCTPEWICSDWTACLSSNTMTRTCSDANNCGVGTGKPAETQACSYNPSVGGTITTDSYSVTLTKLEKTVSTEGYTRVEARVQTSGTGFNAANDVCSEITYGNKIASSLFKGVSGVRIVSSATYSFDFVSEIMDAEYPVQIRIFVGTNISSQCLTRTVSNLSASLLPADLKTFTFSAVPSEFK